MEQKKKEVRLNLWLSEEEQKQIQKLRKKADEERRTLSNYCKKVLFERADK